MPKKSTTKYRKTLPKSAVYTGDGIWDDIVSGGKWLYDKAKDAYKWVRKVKPVSSVANMLGPAGRAIVGEIPLLGGPANTLMDYGLNYGFGKRKAMRHTRKR